MTIYACGGLRSASAVTPQGPDTLFYETVSHWSGTSQLGLAVWPVSNPTWGCAHHFWPFHMAGSGDWIQTLMWQVLNQRYLCSPDWFVFIFSLFRATRNKNFKTNNLGGGSKPLGLNWPYFMSPQVDPKAFYCTNSRQRRTGLWTTQGCITSSWAGGLYLAKRPRSCTNCSLHS